MESAELSKKKRIRHLFPRKEIYHRFIHSAEYAYSPKDSRLRVSCVGNYLIAGDITNKSVEVIENICNWNYYKHSMIAIIDRDLKRIMINKKITDHYVDIHRAVPNDYTIYLVNTEIPNKDILKDTEQCLCLHSQQMIEEYVKLTIVNYLSVLYGTRKVIHSDIRNINSIDKNYSYEEFVKFVKKNKIKKYSFYNQCFNDNYTSWEFKNYYGITKPIKFPTLKQIINNTYFTKEEKLFLEQKHFWTKYCCGDGVPFKDVVKYWNKEISREDAIKYLYSYNFYVSENVFTDETTWNDYISKAITIIRDAHNKTIKEEIEKSNKNYTEALAKLKELANTSYTIEDWRNRKTINNQSVTYRCYVPSRKRGYMGEWINRTLYNRYCDYGVFSTIQLRLDDNKNRIETSLYAAVPLKEGIKMYKLFKTLRKKYPDKTFLDTSDLGDVKVGIYNLRYIKYTEKYDTHLDGLGHKEWVIQIGCHALWLDDIDEFIHYYHLEKEFGIAV